MAVVIVDVDNVDIVEGGGGGLDVDRAVLSEYPSNAGAMTGRPLSATCRLKSISFFFLS